MKHISPIELTAAYKSLGLDTPYHKLLKTEFNIHVPLAVPMYQTEHLYKYLLKGGSESSDGVTATSILLNWLSMPWINMSLEEVEAALEENARPAKKVYADGTIVFSKSRQRYHFYMNGEVDIRNKKMDLLKAHIIRKHGDIAIIEPII